MGARSFRGLFLMLAVLGFLMDQATKYQVFRWLHEDHYNASEGAGRCNIVPGVFELIAQFSGREEADTDFLASLRTWGGKDLPAVNHGALFGFKLGLKNEKRLPNLVFAVVSVMAGLAIGYWGTRRLTERDGLLSVALGLILAGTIGNFYDRVVFGGVRDFLHFYWFEFPVFNVADCCLVCGAGLLLVQAFWVQPVQQDKPVADGALPAASSNGISHIDTDEHR